MAPPETIILPSGLVQASQAQYDNEWQRYKHFTMQRLHYLPGRDCPWTARPLWEYLSHRATSCSPATIRTILSKLARRSVQFNHVLPLQKYEQPTILYKQVRRMVRQLQIDHATRAITKLKGSTPIGSDVVTSILQAFSIHHEASFARLPRACRHHVVACLMQHTAGLRFGHFIYRSYTNADLSWNRLGATLLSNWQRYPGKSAAAITFRFRPKWQCFIYPANDDVSITAAKLLQWHVRMLQPKDLLFEPLVGRKPDRGDRQRWLRLVCKICYTISPRNANAFTNITPHSFRGGMAVDMRMEGASLEQVAARGRWLSRRAVKQYAGKCTLGTMCPRKVQPPLSPAIIAHLEHVASCATPLL